MQQKSKTPIESFGPELMALLLKGALGEVRVKMTYKRAVLLRRRIYQLRHAMREANDPNYTLAARAKLSILWGEKAGLAPSQSPDIHNSKNVPRPADTSCDAIFVVAPHDSEFTKALQDAGVKIDMPDIALPVGNDILEDFVKDD